jgi:hypothetical protein
MWPTPTVPGGGRQPKGGMTVTGMTPDGKKRQVDLAHSVRTEQSPQGWPTPTASEQEQRTTRRTPSQKAGKHGLYLSAEVHEEERAWPSPLARDHRSGKASEETLQKNARPLNEVAVATTACADGERPGSLNPAWVEQLLGFPPGWTDPTTPQGTDDQEAWAGWPARPGKQQYDDEPPRLSAHIPLRAKRLTALGNAVVAQQAAPIFAAIVAIENGEDL